MHSFDVREENSKIEKLTLSLSRLKTFLALTFSDERCLDGVAIRLRHCLSSPDNLICLDSAVSIWKVINKHPSDETL